MLDHYGYALSDPDYYARIDRVEKLGNPYRPSAVPMTWRSTREGIWSGWSRPGAARVDQGWKIHVSAVRSDAQAVLDAVAQVCFRNDVTFKHIASDLFFTFMHHKHASRVQSGKFIAAYPESVDVARKMLDELVEVLGDQQGPHILTDRRYADSKTVHYRYGAFRRRGPLLPSGRWRSLILDGAGREVDDVRGPAFQLPEGIEDPFVRQENAAVRSDGAVVINGYEFVRPLQLSNAGGAYEARQLSSGRRVFIKEARSHNGLHWDNSDACERLSREHSLLAQVHRSAPGLCPEPIEVFRAWENDFLVTEFVPGRDLYTWTSMHSALLRRATEAERITFFDQCSTIMGGLKRHVARLHELGFVFGDLNPKNVLIDDDLSVRLIDFEACAPIEGYDIAMGALGYAAPRGLREGDPRRLDRYGVAALAQTLLLPLHPHLMRDGRGWEWFRRDLSSVAEPPNWLWEEATAFADVSSADRETDALPTAEEFEATPREAVRKLMTLTRRGIESMARATPDSLYPLIPRSFESNVFSLAYGSAGVIHAVLRSGGKPDAGVVEEFRKGALAERDRMPSGLHTGRAGVACVLADLGLLDEATTLMAGVESDPALVDVLDLHQGYAGVGLALLHLHRTVGDEHFLHRATAVRDALTRAAEAYGRPRDPVGLAFGQSGLALFMAEFADRSESDQDKELARELLLSELRTGVRDQHGRLSMPSHTGGNRLMPYLASGSAGVLVALSRILKSRHDDELVQWGMDLLDDVDRVLTIRSGLYEGQAGLVFAMNQFATAIDDDTVSQRAASAASGLMKFAIHDADRVRYLGDGDLRFSADVFSGSGGILIALATCLEPSGVPDHVFGGVV